MVWMWADRPGQLSSRRHRSPPESVHFPPRPLQPLNVSVSSSRWFRFLQRLSLSLLCYFRSQILRLACDYLSRADVSIF